MSYFKTFRFLLQTKDVSKFKVISNFNNYIGISSFTTGDILSLSFKNLGYTFFFEGICIALRKTSLKLPETSLILRNILENVGVELCISFYYNRIYFLRLNNFKRKKASYITSKLFYVRHKINRASRVL